MIFKKGFLLILLRVFIMVGFSIAAVYTYLQTELSITPYMFVALLVVTIIELTWHLQKQERNWTSFLQSIQYGDFNRVYQNKTVSEELQTAYEMITGSMEALQTNREAEFRLLQTVLRHVSIAVVCYKEEGEVVFTNKAFNELLGLPGLIHISKLRDKYPAIYQVMGANEVAPSGWIDHDNGQKLFVKTESFKLKNEALKLASLTDIRNSLDAKELESYQKLMRVMTHEIMNSTTPILSLIRVVNKKLITGEALADLDVKNQRNIAISLEAIEERTAGMLKFVEAYKQINRPIQPHLEPVDSGTFISSITSLVTSQTHIPLDVKDDFQSTLHIDRDLMSQVLINLLKNAVDALEKTTEAKLGLSISTSSDQITIEVTDNGPGVPEKVLSEIFVPFFTTKTHGSGIGLALSRKIVRAHGGTLEYKREEGETRFSIRLGNQ